MALTYKDIERKNDVVCIIATGYAWDACVFGNQKHDYWALNNMYGAVKDTNIFTEWFQIHRPGSGLGHVDDADMREFLQVKWSKVCWVQQDWEDEMPVLNPAIYPINEIIEAYCPRDVYDKPYPYFTNSIDYMLCLAMFRGYKEIQFFGVEFISNVDAEYFTMRQSVNYYLGQAKKMGIKVLVQDHSSLLKAGYWYGYESKRRDRLEDIMRENLKKVEHERSEVQKQLKDLEAKLHVISGGEQTLSQVLNLASLRDKGAQI